MEKDSPVFSYFQNGEEITEEEYGHFMNHILKAGQNPGSAQEPDSSNR